MRLASARRRMLQRIFRSRGVVDYKVCDHEYRLLLRMLDAKQVDVRQMADGGVMFLPATKESA